MSKLRRDVAGIMEPSSTLKQLNAIIRELDDIIQNIENTRNRIPSFALLTFGDLSQAIKIIQRRRDEINQEASQMHTKEIFSGPPKRTGRR